MKAETAASIEFANRLFGDPTIQRSGRFNPVEVRTILTLAHMVDVRQLGCPDAVFDRVIEKNAKHFGIEPAGEPEVNDLSALYEISRTSSAV